MSSKLTNFFARRGKTDSGNAELLEISLPSNFRHTSHIGWTDDATFELRNIPPEWKRFFQAAGIRKRDLEDPETRRAIFAVLFNQDNGDGTDAGPSEAEYDDMPGLGPVIYQQPEPEVSETVPEEVVDAVDEQGNNGEDVAQEQEEEEEEEEEEVPPPTPPRNMPYPVAVDHEHQYPSDSPSAFEEEAPEETQWEGEEEGHGDASYSEGYP